MTTIDVSSAAEPVESRRPGVSELVAERRLRFRDAVAGLGRRATEGDLVRKVLLPGSLLVVAGLIFILFGWWGAASTHREIEQIPYLISGGLFGLGMLFLGGLLLASALWMHVLRQTLGEADRRAREHTDALIDELRAELRGEPVRTPSGNGTIRSVTSPSAPPAAAAEEIWAGDSDDESAGSEPAGGEPDDAETPAETAAVTAGPRPRRAARVRRRLKAD